MKPQMNEQQFSDWVIERFAETCYICSNGDDESNLLVCD